MKMIFQRFMTRPSACLVCFLAMALCACSSPKGSVCDVDGIEVVSLYGSWHQMGCQYGELGREKMLDVLGYIDAQLGGRTESIDSAAVVAERLYAASPDCIKEFFDGLSKSSGISLERVKLCNAVEYIESAFFCSFMAAWGSYSGGRLVAGRNYDAYSYSEIGKDIIVTVFHPDGGMAAAIVGYAGEVYCVNGFNEKGFFVELNNGMPSAGSEIHWDLCPSTSRLLELLLQAETMDDVDSFFRTTQSFSSFVIGVCNKDEARTYEWCHDGVKRGDGVCPEGLAVSTNHYVNGEWPYAVPTDESSWNSITRRANLLEMAEKHKGNIDVETMESILSASLEDGGPHHALTRYQIVAVPADYTLHIHVPGIADWAEVNLQKFF